MGWVGVATLFATTCYVLYRFPPRTWAQQPDPTIPHASPESIPGQQAENSANDRGKPSSNIPETKPVLNNNHNKEEKEEGEEENAETTPKASAASAPILNVPELDLNDQKPTQNRSTKKSESALSQQDKSFSSLPQSTAKVARDASATMPPLPPPPPQPVPTPSQRNSSSLMPAPPLPRHRVMGQQTQQSQLLSPGGYPPRSGPGNINKGSGSFLAPPPSAAAAQRGPPQRSSLAPPSNSLAPPTQSASLKPSKAAPSRRAILEPGYSPLDWAALTSNPKNNLRGANLPPTLIRVTPSMLKTQNGRKGCDAWTSYQGKVYNITPYVPFHPGGKGELLRGAGKDSARLFLEVHPWVNWDAILSECLVGILVSENEAAQEGNALDAMD